MSDHYFSNKPQSQSKPSTWSFELRGQTMKFTSDYGVFSKSEVDFGSRTLIDAFVEPSIDGVILDLGCGYGPIGLSLARAYSDRQFVLSDINERAVSLAEQNAKQNGIANVTFHVSDGMEGLRNHRYAAILINPPIRAGKDTIFRMFEESYTALLDQGELWIVIQKKQGAPSTQKKLQEIFAEVNVVNKNKGYFIFCAKKLDN
ncbi:class I SAM-dependent methyltransferase [Radiobacillus sp. PE A8.2]|uniref:class I SAM-dependent methyltransferase n=1 Tax=Radiobacillus sp. PE A8.2 TaxID=3380349 RepID=UPI00388ED665